MEIVKDIYNIPEEKTIYGDSPVYLKFLTAQQYWQLESPMPTSVHCFPIEGNKVLFTVNPRGIDIIGGHVEKGETVEIALQRECMEEASIELISYRFIGAIQVDNRDNPNALKKGYPLKGYQLFYVSSHYNELEFKADFECTSRQYVDFKDIKTTHHNWLKTHDNLLEEMEKLAIDVKKLKI
jgi:8-oxo-dGTP pyrophosphatase MutT (NUDIX family)